VAAAPEAVRDAFSHAQARRGKAARRSDITSIDGESDLS
jgi:hypothetical protein